MNPEEVLNLCIQLAANDKITSKNCWQLQLIDTMDEVLDYEHCDFIKCSGAIQASAKIYSGRVDALAQQCEGLNGATQGAVQEESQQEDTPIQSVKKQSQVKRKPLKQLTNQQLSMKITPNAFFDSDFHKMFAVSQDQLLLDSDLIIKTLSTQPNTAVEDDISGMQQLLTKSQRFMEASQIAIEQPIALNYDINENELENASYASFLDTSTAAPELYQQQAQIPSKLQKLGPRAPPKPKQPKKLLNFDVPELKFVTPAKTQSKFTQINPVDLTIPHETKTSYFPSAVFEQQNCGKFLISNYEQTQISKLPSITELSFHKEVKFEQIGFDEMDQLIMEEDGLGGEGDENLIRDLESQNLISQKLKIGLNVIQTKFAKRSTQVDIQALKKQEINIVQGQAGQQQTLNQIHDSYPSFHTTKVCKNAEDVSVQMMFVGFLHLANEGKVDLKQQDGKVLVSYRQ